MAQSKKVRARFRKASKDFTATVAHHEALEAIKARRCRVAALEAEIFGSPLAPRLHIPENTRAPLNDEFVALLIAAIRHFIRPCPFLTKLPVEIRLIIYGYVFDEPCETYDYPSIRESLSQEGKRGLQKLLISISPLYDDPPILQVCRQIRQEAYHEYLSFMEARKSRKAQEMVENPPRPRKNQGDCRLLFLSTGSPGIFHLCYGL